MDDRSWRQRFYAEAAALSVVLARTTSRLPTLKCRCEVQTTRSTQTASNTTTWCAFLLAPAKTFRCPPFTSNVVILTSDPIGSEKVISCVARPRIFPHTGGNRRVVTCQTPTLPRSRGRSLLHARHALARRRLQGRWADRLSPEDRRRPYHGFPGIVV
jgi:hypothetical protein